MLSKFPSELPDTMSLVTTGRNQSRFENCLRICCVLDSRRPWQVERLPSSRISGNSANCVLIQKNPCLCRSDGNDVDPINRQFRIARRLGNFPGSFFDSGQVGVAVDEEHVELGFRGEYSPHFPLQHRGSTCPGITYAGERDRCPHHLRCAAMRQQQTEVWNQRPVRSPLAQEEKANHAVVHGNQAEPNGRRSCTPSGGCR